MSNSCIKQSSISINEIFFAYYVSTLLWHNRLGHLPLAAMKHIDSMHLISNFEDYALFNLSHG